MLANVGVYLVYIFGENGIWGILTWPWLGGDQQGHCPRGEHAIALPSGCGDVILGNHPKWVSLRCNFWQRGLALAQPPFFNFAWLCTLTQYRILWSITSSTLARAHSPYFQLPHLKWTTRTPQIKDQLPRLPNRINLVGFLSLCLSVCLFLHPFHSYQKPRGVLFLYSLVIGYVLWPEKKTKQRVSSRSLRKGWRLLT